MNDFLYGGEVNNKKEPKDLFKIVDKTKEEIINLIKKKKQMIAYLYTKEDQEPSKIIKEKIVGLSIFNEEEKEASYVEITEEEIVKDLKEIWENEEIKKIGINLSKVYILLKQIGIDLKGINYDVSISSYILNPSRNKLEIENLMQEYLEIDLDEWIRRRAKTRANQSV